MLIVDFVNVGYGEAIVITSKKKNFCVVIDGGSNNEIFYSNNDLGRIKLIDYLRREQISSIDIMFCTHIHDDHVGGLLEIARYMEVKKLYQPFPSEFYKELDQIMPQENGIDTELFTQAVREYIDLCKLVDRDGEVCQCHITEKINVNSKCKIEVLGPSSKQIDFLRFYFVYAFSYASRNLIMMLDEIINNYSLVLRVNYKGTKMLLPGDMTCDGYDGLSDKKLAAEIFKVGHHGKKDGINESLLKKIQPSTVIICADERKKHSSVSREMVSMLKEKGLDLYFSDAINEYEVKAHNAIRVTMHGEKAYEVNYISVEG